LRAGAWGVAFGEIMDAYTLEAAPNPDTIPGAPTWPFVRPGGLACRVLESLSIERAAVAQLRALPEAVHPLDTDERVAALRALLKSYAAHLHPGLAFEAVATTPAAALAARRAANTAADAGGGGAVDEDPLEVFADSGRESSKSGRQIEPLTPEDRRSAQLSASQEADALERSASGLSVSPSSSALPEAVSRGELESVEAAAVAGALAQGGAAAADSGPAGAARDAEARGGPSEEGLAGAPALTEGAALCEPFFDVARCYRVGSAAAGADTASARRCVPAAGSPEGALRAQCVGIACSQSASQSSSL
jgi:hypothetical protein